MVTPPLKSKSRSSSKKKHQHRKPVRHTSEDRESSQPEASILKALNPNPIKSISDNTSLMFDQGENSLADVISPLKVPPTLSPNIGQNVLLKDSTEPTSPQTAAIPNNSRNHGGRVKQQNAPRNSSKSKMDRFDARDDSLLNEIKLEFEESGGGEQQMRPKNKDSQILAKTSKLSDGKSMQRSKYMGFRPDNVSLGISSSNMNLTMN